MPSSPRRRGPITSHSRWVPAFAGMTMEGKSCAATLPPPPCRARSGIHWAAGAAHRRQDYCQAEPRTPEQVRGDAGLGAQP
ncbi:hypothetical protein EAH79_15120 [Sphingomonas koreensis]|nr:hypothetical protein EAH79_15120 [Sphingomonas koreensis]